jgi:hypothetical protein
MKEFNITLTLTQSMLGTKPADPNIFAAYIATKRPDGPAKDEQESAEATEISGTTGFHKHRDGRPFIYDYQINGFFKEASSAMRQVEGSLSEGVASLKSKIDLLVFPFPRTIDLKIPTGGGITVCERALRAETMQGPRVALARSEEVPEGTQMVFQVVLLADSVKNKDKETIKLKDLLVEWLNYGVLHGLGQWRNSGRGRFVYTIEERSNGSAVKTTEMAGPSEVRTEQRQGVVQHDIARASQVGAVAEQGEARAKRGIARAGQGEASATLASAEARPDIAEAKRSDAQAEQDKAQAGQTEAAGTVRQSDAWAR